MKNTGIVIVLLLALLAGCAADAPVETQGGAQPTSEERFPAPGGDTAIKMGNINDPDSIIEIPDVTFAEFLDSCEAIVKAEIISSEPFGEDDSMPQTRYKCRIITDYLGNIDSRGMDEGEIYIYAIEDPLLVDKTCYLMLIGNANVFYPHVPYVYNEKWFLAFEDGDGLGFKTDWYHNYGLTAESDLDQILADYADTREVAAPQPASDLPDIGSYSDAVQQCDVALKVEITEKANANEYIDRAMCEIKEELRGVSTAGIGGTERFPVPTGAEVEVGGTYIFLLNEKGYPISREYSVVGVDDPAYAEVYQMLTAQTD